MPSKRAIYSIREDILEEFNRVIPLQERSKLVEALMARHVQALESQLHAAARAIEEDADYRELRDDVTGLTAETAVRLLPYE